jgi:hypothetical protein
MTRPVDQAAEISVNAGDVVPAGTAEDRVDRTVVVAVSWTNSWDRACMDMAALRFIGGAPIAGPLFSGQECSDGFTGE